MNVYTCTSFKGHWPTGVAAVIVAKNEEQAAALLEEELATVGLRQKLDVSQFEDISVNSPRAYILVDGNY